jgi:hypothetical protein
MKRFSVLVLLSCANFLVGCVALGFIDDDKFMQALKDRRCKDAYQMVANANFHDVGERWTYQGQVEYFCFRNHDEGVRLLTKGAEYGDRWAKSTLARTGERLPDYTNMGRGGVDATSINLRIIRD